MVIGINAAAAFKQPRTGVEQYTYQLIKHLSRLKAATKHRFILYTPSCRTNDLFSILPGHFLVRHLKWPLPMWTQIKLANEIRKQQLDVFFIPVHVLPLIHPDNSVVSIHGLEYEYYPKMYPSRHLRYLRWSTKYALKNARKIIAVSANTKNDLVKLYGGQSEKIEVVHHGVEVPDYEQIRQQTPQTSIPYILFIGRLEQKKNIEGILEAYKLLRQRYRVPHSLVLVGPPGYGYNILKFRIQDLKSKIIEKGYVSEDEKWNLLKNAEMYILPSFYEGFGLPILEAQALGCPVVTSNISSMPEIAGRGAILVNPMDIEQISEAMYKIISDSQLRRYLINMGYQNVKRFSWQTCAQKTLDVLMQQ